MSRKLRDKYSRRLEIKAPGILAEDNDDVSEEKLIRVISRGLDINTLVYIQVKTSGTHTWENIGSIEGSTSKIFDISLYDQIRYNVFTFGGTPATMEIVSAVDSDQNVIEKDAGNKDSLRVIDAVPIEGDAKTAFLNGLLTLQFWSATGFDISTINFVVTEDNEPVLTRDGQFIEV